MYATNTPNVVSAVFTGQAWCAHTSSAADRAKPAASSTPICTLTSVSVTRPAGIGRYGSAYSPMDETLARVALDISGRPYFVWKAGFTQEKLGEWDTELIEHWFHSVSQTAGITLHMELLYGTNNHHICEALYKGFARAMRVAVENDPRKGGAIPSTKGTLGG